MGKHGKRALVLLMAVLSMFVIAACGDDDDDDGGGGGGAGRSQAGRIDNDRADSQPTTSIRRSATRSTAGSRCGCVHTAVTYKRAEGEEGTELIPGVAEKLPKVSKDGKTVTFTMRKGLKLRRTPLKASDFEHTTSER